MSVKFSLTRGSVNHLEWTLLLINLYRKVVLDVVDKLQQLYWKDPLSESYNIALLPPVPTIIEIR